MFLETEPPSNPGCIKHPLGRPFDARKRGRTVIAATLALLQEQLRLTWRRKSTAGRDVARCSHWIGIATGLRMSRRRSEGTGRDRQ